MNTLWREEKIDEAVQTVRDMERRGIVGSAALYYDFARCLCSGGRCQEALMQVITTWHSCRCPDVFVVLVTVSLVLILILYALLLPSLSFFLSFLCYLPLQPCILL